MSAEPAGRPKDRSATFASKTSDCLGSKWAFTGAALVIVIWAISGPLAHFSNTWQLIINTGTTIVTFLMVFLIQNTQNRGARAINLKLDELIRALDQAGDQMIDIKKMGDKYLDCLKDRYEKIKDEGDQARKALYSGERATA